MKTTKLALTAVIFACLISIFFSVSSIAPGTNIGSFFATASKGTEDAFNVFTIDPLPLFSLQAPFFSLIPITKSILGNDATDTLESVFTTTKKIISTALNPTPANSTNTSTKDPIRDALVNIFCSERIGNLKKTITGSGVLIDDSGTVLTNAHVGEYPLIADTSSKVVCIARTGSPATVTHGVSAIFISPDWVRQYASYLEKGLTETGQNDYAILKIKDSAGNPITTSYLSLAGVIPSIGSSIYAASYPSDILGTKGVNTPLESVKDEVTIQNSFNFDSTMPVAGNADTITTSETSVGQHGSSGGAVTNMRNNLIGMITLTTPGSSSDKNHITALTIPYLDAQISRYITGGLQGIVQDGGSAATNAFDSNYRSSLTSLLLQYVAN